ncbi:hypothetical protein BDN72DRAFT_5594 [Pluteus cervinus]|uniref:Uncharacterized protein n=1 Tax=Pluteus cervinus TaxID=181527 RepID=A0ACD3BFA4_9AGAR|nr:hypothetical protein BDN72DRAFT_5594 [Pluteus cervinus]
MLFNSLPLYLLLLVLDVPSASAGSFPHALERAHKLAARHSRNLARDLRVAFGGILVARDSTPVTPQHVVYCKTKPASSLGGNGGPKGNSSSPSSSTRTATSGGVAPTSSAPSSSPWKLTESHSGSNFFDGWSFWNQPDPTSGTVQYLDENTAWANNLIQITSDGHAIMRVQTTPNITGNRQSVRIQTNSQFTGGLVIMDSVHMPTGCGTWPAFWTNGPTWPMTGEIDIIEGVGDYTNNQATIHTNPGCTLPSTDSNALSITGNVVGGTDCAALTTGNQGCGVRASTSNTFGAGFNSNGGGVYAMQWDTTGVSVYFFPSNSIPADIQANVPHPETWGNPQAKWPASTCDPFKFFQSHSVIFDTTFCGDWAGAVWSAAGIPGQEQSCAQRTGYSTCEAFVRASGAFQQAYWEVRSVKIYQLQS